MNKIIIIKKGTCNCRPLITFPWIHPAATTSLLHAYFYGWCFFKQRRKIMPSAFWPLCVGSTLGYVLVIWCFSSAYIIILYRVYFIIIHNPFLFYLKKTEMGQEKEGGDILTGNSHTLKLEIIFYNDFCWNIEVPTTMLCPLLWFWFIF